MRKPKTTSSEDRAAAVERAVAFSADTDGLAADSVQPHPLGRALFSASLRQMWVLNQLQVLGPQPDLDAESLIAELDRLYSDLPHRRVFADDDATGNRLGDGLSRRGFSAERDAVMLLEGRPPDPPPGIAREADEPAFRAAELAITYDLPGGTGEPEMLIEGRARMRAGRDGTRTFIGSHDGVDACTVTLHTDGRIGQVEDVATLVAHRGHGVAGATVALAAREALDAGNEIVFLLVDSVTGPVALYERVGFRVAGHTWSFTRPG